MNVHVLERVQLVRRPRHEVFSFFSDARNLEAITPGFLRFRIEAAGELPMHEGARISYALSLFGVPFRWLTLIETWEPERRFVDLQLSGPYALWRHTHTFEDAPGGTWVRDRVEYALPLGPLGRVAHALLVRRTLERIFDHRRERIEALLPPAEPARAGA